MSGGNSYRETDWYRAAYALAVQAHKHQVDKGGAPYMKHLERVADRLVRRWPDATPAQIQIALLHDIIEDGQVGGTEFARVADDHVMLTVHLITNPRTMPYLDYIRTIASSGNIDAIRVKLADNEDNSAPERAHPDAARLLEQKYRPAKAILEKALQDYEATQAERR